MKVRVTFFTLCAALVACTQEKNYTLAPVDAPPPVLPFTVPSDARANFYILEKGNQGNERVIVTKREGPSGTSYSKRLYNCADHTVKYLGTGDSLEAMDVSPADPAMGPIVEGSIAYYVGLQACG
jgi:hypothetical protein